MLACQKGFLTIVEYLIEQGAKVEGRDRFKRTPLIHACMYGNAHVVSYLLRRGANAKVFDSSSNTALHYAIAYGCPCNHETQNNRVETRRYYKLRLDATEIIF